MLLDRESLRPVIIAMALYIAVSVVVPKVATKPTGVQVIDDITMNIIAQKGAMMPGTILVGLIVLATFYINEEFA
jgi:hypothetical protein